MGGAKNAEKKRKNFQVSFEIFMKNLLSIYI